jgi:inhibitor of cysteine peptidase
MEAVTITEADAGRTVSVTPGQHLVLRLPENPTTGYRWSVPAGVSVVSDTYEAGGTQAGAGGQRVLTLVAPQAAMQAELRLQRPRGGDVAQTFSVTLAPRAE